MRSPAERSILGTTNNLDEIFMNIYEESSAHYFLVQSEREWTLEF